MSDDDDMADVTDDDVRAAMDLTRITPGSVAPFEVIRMMLAQDRSRHTRCSCGRARHFLCWDCDRDQLDDLGSQ